MTRARRRVAGVFALPGAAAFARAAEVAARALACAAVALIAFVARPAEASVPDAHPRELSLELAAYGFAADADDATAILLNPAALGGAQGMDLIQDLSGGSGSGGFPDAWTTALQGGSWGFAYRHRDPASCGMLMPTPDFEAGPFAEYIPLLPRTSASCANVDGYVLAVAQGVRWLRAGVAREWVNVDIPGHDLRTWTVGLHSRPLPSISLGGTLERLDTPRYLEGELRPRYTYGVAVRPPIPLAVAVTLNVQGSHEDGGHGRVDMQYGLRAVFEQGVDLALFVADPNGDSPSLGFSVTRRLGHGAISGRGRWLADDGDGRESRASFALEAFDDLWRRTHAPAAPGAITPANIRSR